MSFVLPDADGSDGHVLTTDGSGNLSFAQAAGGGGFMAGNLLPNSAMTYWRSGTSAAPTYTYLWGTGATISGTSSAINTDVGWKATVTNAADNEAIFGWRYGQNGFTSGNVVDLTSLKGKEVTLGAWVKSSTANRVRLRISDGVTSTYSSYHAGDSNWAWTTVTKTLSSSATSLLADLFIDTGVSISAEVELFCLVRGSTCDYWAPYVSRQRVARGGGQITSTGNTVVTGAPFSPLYVQVFGVQNGDGSDHSFGMAWLDGATINHSGCYENTYMVSYDWRPISTTGGTISAFGSDGCTVNCSFFGANSHFYVMMFEGNPI